MRVQGCTSSYILCVPIWPRCCVVPALPPGLQGVPHPGPCCLPACLPAPSCYCASSSLSSRLASPDRRRQLGAAAGGVRGHPGKAGGPCHVPAAARAGWPPLRGQRHSLAPLDDGRHGVLHRPAALQRPTAGAVPGPQRRRVCVLLAVVQRIASWVRRTQVVAAAGLPAVPRPWPGMTLAFAPLCLCRPTCLPLWQVQAVAHGLLLILQQVGGRLGPTPPPACVCVQSTKGKGRSLARAGVEASLWRVVANASPRRHLITFVSCACVRARAGPERPIPPAAGRRGHAVHARAPGRPRRRPPRWRRVRRRQRQHQQHGRRVVWPARLVPRHLPGRPHAGHGLHVHSAVPGAAAAKAQAQQRRRRRRRRQQRIADLAGAQ